MISLPAPLIGRKPPANIIAEQLDFPLENIIEKDEVYHAGTPTLVKLVESFHRDIKSVMIVGHNPGFTDLANYLKEPDYYIGNVPTCGVVAIEFTVNQWTELNKHCGRMLFFDYPRKAL